MKTKSLDLSKTYVTKVQSVDPLGQGRSIIDDVQVYIPKVIEEETIELEITHQKNAHAQAKVVNIITASSKRITSECTHYGTCPGCHYQHVTYEDEVAYKKNSLERAMSYLKIKDFNVQFISPSKRLGYRNRIQLHYELTPKPTIGFLDASGKNSHIVSVPNCLLPDAKLKSFLKDFTQSWVSSVPEYAPNAGHVELYLQNNQVHIAWNQEYSHLGFTQVNDEGNQLLQSCVVSQMCRRDNSRNVLELFCGTGNLLKKLPDNFLITGLDINGSLSPPHQFHLANLYLENERKRILHLLKNQKIHDLVLDPPRTGFKELHQFVTAFQSIERLIYVSCWPSTMVRDLNTIYALRPWTKIQVWGIDMFPSTKHYETVVVVDWT